MITIILAETTDDLEKVRHYLVPKKEHKEWLTAAEFTAELKKMGYKAGTHITRRKYAAKHGVEMIDKEGRIFYKNELEKIPNRK